MWNGARVNPSTSRLAHLFRREASVAAAVRETCTYAAGEALIGDKFLSVKQVTITSGFDDASHFVEDFQTTLWQDS